MFLTLLQAPVLAELASLLRIFSSDVPTILGPKKQHNEETTNQDDEYPTREGISTQETGSFLFQEDREI